MRTYHGQDSVQPAYVQGMMTPVYFLNIETLLTKQTQTQLTKNLFSLMSWNLCIKYIKNGPVNPAGVSYCAACCL